MASTTTISTLSTAAGVTGLGGYLRHRVNARKDPIDKRHCLRVPKGAVAFVTFFGYPLIRQGEPVMKSEGSWFRWPGQRYRCITVIQGTREMKRQRIQLKDGIVYDVEPIITFRVTDPFKALFEVRDGHWYNMLVDRCAAAIQEVFKSMTHQQVLRSRTLLSKVTKRAQEAAAACGVEVIEVRFTDCGPDHMSEQVTLIQAKVGTLAGVSDKDRQSIAKLRPADMVALTGTPTTLGVGLGPNDPSEPDIHVVGDESSGEVVRMDHAQHHA